MHEMAIAQRLLDTASAALSATAGASINIVHVRLGALAGVSREELLFGFDVVKSGTRFENAHLEIEEVAAIVYCTSCDWEYPLTEPSLLLCPVCDSARIQVVQGKELILQSVEADECTDGPVQAS